MTKIFDEDMSAAFGTRAIHAGQRPDPLSGAIMTPIYQTSTYVQEALGVNKGYEYARGKNPTREALERNVAALEGARHGFAFSSGMGCLDSIMKLFKSGDHFVVGENVYGGTYRLFDKILRNYGMTFSYVDTRDPQLIADACTSATAGIIVETPTNPLMRLTDIRAAADIAHAHSALLIVDNTFSSPYFQQPFSLGADIVWHSSTKYLNGHSDMVGGIALVDNDDLAARLQFVLNAAGAVPGPMAAWLANKLGDRNVFYPGLESHPQHALAVKQMTGFGGMISLETGSRERAACMLQRVHVFSLAESLGGVESLINHPAEMTHASVEPAKRAQLGITAGLVRLSCGVEDVGDLIADLDQALK